MLILYEIFMALMKKILTQSNCIVLYSYVHRRLFEFSVQLLHFFANLTIHITGVYYLKRAECNISEILIKSSTRLKYAKK